MGADTTIKWEKTSSGYEHTRDDGTLYRINHDGTWNVRVWNPNTTCWHDIGSFELLRDAKEAVAYRIW